MNSIGWMLSKMKAVDKDFSFGCEGVLSLVSNHSLNWGESCLKKYWWIQKMMFHMMM